MGIESSSGAERNHEVIGNRLPGRNFKRDADGSRTMRHLASLAMLGFGTGLEESGALDTPSVEPASTETGQAEIPTPVDPATQA